MFRRAFVQRLAPSFARMCSTCALTVSGATVNSPAISEFGETCGDEARDLEFADGERCQAYLSVMAAIQVA